jgi:hypothetical protein
MLDQAEFHAGLKRNAVIVKSKQHQLIQAHGRASILNPQGTASFFVSSLVPIEMGIIRPS